jgi:hypothetical protein
MIMMTLSVKQVLCLTDMNKNYIRSTILVHIPSTKFNRNLISNFVDEISPRAERPDHFTISPFYTICVVA